VYPAEHAGVAATSVPPPSVQSKPSCAPVPVQLTPQAVLFASAPLLTETHLLPDLHWLSLVQTHAWLAAVHLPLALSLQWPALHTLEPVDDAVATRQLMVSPAVAVDVQAPALLLSAVCLQVLLWHAAGAAATHALMVVRPGVSLAGHVGVGTVQLKPSRGTKAEYTPVQLPPAPVHELLLFVVSLTHFCPVGHWLSL
jgi:hypothetical protein